MVALFLSLQVCLFFPCLIFFLIAVQQYSCFTILCQFLLYSKVDQQHTYIYPLFCRFFSHLGHHKALSRVPCAMQLSFHQLPILNTVVVYVNSNLPVHPTSSSPLVSVCLFFMSVSLFLLYKFICIIFLDLAYKEYYAILIFLFLMHFTLYDSLQAYPCL